MKRVAAVLFILAVVLVIAPASFAQAATPAKQPINTTTLVISAGFGVAVAALGGGLGQGRIAAAACEGIARHPGATAGVRGGLNFWLTFWIKAGGDFLRPFYFPNKRSRKVDGLGAAARKNAELKPRTKWIAYERDYFSPPISVFSRRRRRT